MLTSTKGHTERRARRGTKPVPELVQYSRYECRSGIDTVLYLYGIDACTCPGKAYSYCTEIPTTGTGRCRYTIQDLLTAHTDARLDPTKRNMLWLLSSETKKTSPPPGAICTSTGRPQLVPLLMLTKPVMRGLYPVKSTRMVLI